MTFLIVLHVLVCLFMVFVILLQPGKSDGGIGFGSSSQSIFGSKGAGNFLTKTTSVCAILFLVTSFFLTRHRMSEYSHSVIGTETVPATTSATPADATKMDAAKPVEEKKSDAPAQPKK